MFTSREIRSFQFVTRFFLNKKTCQRLNNTLKAVCRQFEIK